MTADNLYDLQRLLQKFYETDAINVRKTKWMEEKINERKIENRKEKKIYI